MAHVEGHVLSDQEDGVTPSVSIAIESNVHGFCRAILDHINTNHMLDDCFLKHVILTKMNAKFEEINSIVGVYIPDGITTFEIAATAEDEDENALRYPMKTMNYVSHDSGLPVHGHSLKKCLVVILPAPSPPLS